MNKLKRRDFLHLAGMNALLLTTGCIKKNLEGRSGLRLLPAGILNSQATSAYNEEKKKNKVSTDARLTGIVNRVTGSLIEQTNRIYPEKTKDYKWEVSLFDDSKTVNAYAMPGGKIAVFTGILGICDNEAGLATVIGHEIGHVILEHGNERVSQQLGVTAVTAVGATAMSMNSKLSQDMQKTIVQAAGAGLSVGLLLPYSRKHEHEADRMGIRLTAAGGYDPAESPLLWQRMEEKYGSHGPSYLSTHPSNKDRRDKLTAQVPEMMQYYNAAPAKHGKGEKLV